MSKPGTLTRAKLARRLKVDEKTIDRWINRGCPFELVEGRAYFDETDVEAWKLAQTLPSLPQATNGQIQLIHARIRQTRQKTLAIFSGKWVPACIAANLADLFVEKSEQFISKHLRSSGRLGFFYADQCSVALDELRKAVQDWRARPVVDLSTFEMPAEALPGSIKEARDVLSGCRAAHLAAQGYIASGAMIEESEFGAHQGLAIKRVQGCAMDHFGWPGITEPARAVEAAFNLEVLAPIRDGIGGLV